MKKRLLDVITLILIAIIFIGSLFTKDWHYCYISLLLFISKVLIEILSEIKK